MSIVDIDTTESIHRAAQYLAAAGIQYLDNKEDDSHTNFGWDKDRKAFISRNLNGNKLYLGLNLKYFRLEFLRNDIVLASKPVAGSRHKHIMEWLNEVFRDLGFNTPFKFNLHYDLPYEDKQEEFLFEDVDKVDLTAEHTLRRRAYEILNRVKGEFTDISEIRTWPHHFDTGGIIKLGGEYSIGIGMAIPDSLSNEYYFYASAWKGHEMQDVSSYSPLINGKWLNGSWKGGMIQSNHTDKEILAFYKEVIDYLK